MNACKLDPPTEEDIATEAKRKANQQEWERRKYERKKAKMVAAKAQTPTPTQVFTPARARPQASSGAAILQSVEKFATVLNQYNADHSKTMDKLAQAEAEHSRVTSGLLGSMFKDTCTALTARKAFSSPACDSTTE